MKKVMYLLNRAKATTMLLAALFAMNVASAETGTETNPTANDTKDADIVGKCYTIPGTHNPQGAGDVGSLGKGLKLRTGNDGNRLVFNVNEGYTITNFVLNGVANDEGNISTVKVEVDDTETTFEGGGTFTKNNVANITIKDIKATKSIAIYFNNDEVVKNKQIFAVYSIGWEKSSTEPGGEEGGDEDGNWFGLTQKIDESTKRLGAATFTGTEHVTNGGNAMGTNVNSYAATGSGKTMYINGTDYITETHWRKTQNTKAYDDNQWMGYNLTIETGYKLNITGVHAMIAIGDNTTYTWKVVIQDASGKELYVSKDKTTKQATTTDFSVTLGELDANVQTALTGITAGASVRIYMYQEGSTKYFAVPYLTITGTVEEDSRATNTITANVAEGQENWGSVDKAGDNDVVEGESIALTAKANEGYAFSKWTKASDDTWSSTANPLVVSNVTANETYTASFEKLFKVTFDLGGYNGTITGKTLNQYDESRNINEKYADINGNYTIPSYADKYLYNEGNIFKEWTDDEGNTYASGTEIVLTKDITLTPTWTSTTTLAKALGNASAETKVTWAFAKSEILFNDWQSSDYGYYTVNATINGETIAVPMKIANGKVSNQGRTDALAQTNIKTVFTIPAVSGMSVSIADAYTNFSATTIAGSTEYEGTGTKTISYTYTGSAETIDIVIGEDNQYLKTIVVTYPKKTTSFEVGEAGYRTFASSSALDFSGVEGLTAYYAVENDGRVEFVKIEGKVPAKEGMLIKAEEGTYYIPLASTTPEKLNEGDNIFVSELNSETKKAPKGSFVLMNGDKGVGFYRTTAEEFTLTANTAYIPANVAGTRTFISLDGETTGIDAAIVNNDKQTTGVYNLNGQRVAQPTKGLYIVNGKKVVIK